MPKRQTTPTRASRAPAQASHGRRGTGSSHPAQPWTFLTNHSHVLVCLLQDPAVRLRDVAARIGITERAVQKIVADLETAGILRRIREGRRNRYSMSLDLPLRHSVEAHCSVREILMPILKAASAGQ